MVYVWHRMNNTDRLTKTFTNVVSGNKSYTTLICRNLHVHWYPKALVSLAVHQPLYQPLSRRTQILSTCAPPDTDPGRMRSEGWFSHNIHRQRQQASCAVPVPTL